MTYELQINMSTYILGFLVIFVMPIVITVGAEYGINKAITIKVIIFSLIVSTASFIAMLMQFSSSKVILNPTNLEINSLLYSEVVDFKDIETIVYVEDLLPPEQNLAIRKNGIGLFGYKAGTYALKDKSRAFVQMTTAPYIFITLKDEQKSYIITSNKEVYLEILDLTKLSEKL